MTVVALGEIAELRSGVGFPPRLQGRTHGDFPMAKVGDVSRVGRSTSHVLSTADNFVDSGDLGELRMRPVPAGGVLFAKIGEAIRQNHRVVAGRPVLVDNNVMAAIPRPSVVDGAYLFRFLQSVDLYEYASSTTVPSLRKTELARIEVRLPTGAEQRRIAAVLERADALRVGRRRCRDHVDELSSAIFAQMFGASSGVPVTLTEIAEVKGGKRLPKGSGYCDGPTAHRYIRVLDLRGDGVDPRGLRFVSDEVHAKMARYVVAAEDVIISIAGTVGVTSAVPADLAGANLTENAARIVPRSGDLYRAEWLARALRTAALQDQIRSHVGRVTIGKLALFRIEQLRLSLPPLVEQDRFLSRLAALRSVAEPAGSRHEEELFASLQARAFRGAL